MSVYEDFLTRVIDDGLDAVRLDYADDELKYAGAVAGFEACRDKTASQIIDELDAARLTTQEKHAERAEDYWYWRCRAAEIEWVLNCIAAVDSSVRVAGIPTMRGAMKAREVMTALAGQLVVELTPS